MVYESNNVIENYKQLIYKMNIAVVGNRIKYKQKRILMKSSKLYYDIFFQAISGIFITKIGQSTSEVFGVMLWD